MVRKNLLAPENLDYYTTQYDSLDTITHDEFMNSMIDAQKRLLTVKLDEEKCYVSNSPIHGKGVFAKFDISQGNIITMYPCHELNVNYGKTTFSFSQETFEWSPEHQCCISDMFSFFGNPNDTDNESALGHMINDISKPASLSDTDILDYIWTADQNNCTRQMRYFRINVDHGFVELPVVIYVATKNIKMGEEITISYGSNFWKYLIEYKEHLGNERENAAEY